MNKPEGCTKTDLLAAMGDLDTLPSQWRSNVRREHEAEVGGDISLMSGSARKYTSTQLLPPPQALFPEPSEGRLNSEWKHDVML